MKNLILCADDYAQSDEISTGIRMAYEAGRINAISCLTNMPDWPKAGSALLKTCSKGLLGLHLNFTFGHALSSEWRTHYAEVFQSLPRLIFLNYFRQLNPAIVIAECAAQLNAFRDVMGRDPDFFDGHQHVHQLPVMRQGLLTLFSEEHLQGFVRVAAHHRGFIRKTISAIKVLVIAHLGGVSLRGELKQAHIPMNTSFSGVYSFRQSAHYRQFFNQFLAESDHYGLIMCHPGLPSNDKTDPLYSSRNDELRYLMSDEFLSDLRAYGFELASETIP
jgi:predicted glycoside hydrolase/deacetylase ChbG (UPF0249 family)